MHVSYMYEEMVCRVFHCPCSMLSFSSCDGVGDITLTLKNRWVAWQRLRREHPPPPSEFRLRHHLYTKHLALSCGWVEMATKSGFREICGFMDLDTRHAHWRGLIRWQARRLQHPDPVGMALSSRS
jgi:hypothetical protein